MLLKPIFSDGISFLSSSFLRILSSIDFPCFMSPRNSSSSLENPSAIKFPFEIETGTSSLIVFSILEKIVLHVTNFFPVFMIISLLFFSNVFFIIWISPILFFNETSSLGLTLAVAILEAILSMSTISFKWLIRFSRQIGFYFIIYNLWYSR